MLDTLKKITMSCRKVFTKVTLNLIQGLPPELWSFRNSNNAGGRFQIKFGMTCLHNNHAFTLIELLVVVLIIGILSAVALPQYQKAVWKSRNVQLKAILQTFRQAQDVYYMEHGQYAANFGDLDVDMPLTATEITGDEKSGNYVLEPVCKLAVFGEDAVRAGSNFQLVLNGESVGAVWTDGPYKCSGFKWAAGGKLQCYSRTDSGVADAFCAGLERGVLVPGSGAGGWSKYDLP